MHLNCKDTKLKPWISQGLIRSTRHSDKLKKRVILKTDDSQNKFKEYRNILGNLIKEAKNLYYANRIGTVNKDIMKT